MSGVGNDRAGFRLKGPSWLMLPVLALAVLASGEALSQGATDTKSEGQVKPQVIQNPIIPGDRKSVV